MGRKRHTYTIFGGKARMKATTRRTILKLILEKQDAVVQTGFIWLRIGINQSSCEHCNKPYGSMKCWGILE
jgi:predicted metal-binding protein